MIETMLTIFSPAILMTVLLCGLFMFVISRAIGNRHPVVKDYSVDRRQFLTAREMDAFRLLVPIAAASNLHVCPQASMDSFLQFGGEAAFRERGRYKARRSDFALMDRKGNVVMVVEIDDASHRGREQQDAARDKVVAMAGIPTVRVPVGRLPDAGELERLLNRSLSRTGRTR